MAAQLSIGGFELKAPGASTIASSVIFDALGSKYKFASKVTAFLVDSMKLSNLEEFRYAFGNEKDINELLIAKLNLGELQGQQKARVLVAWTAVKDAMARQSELESKGAASSDLDEPLPRPALDNISDLFYRRYKLSFSGEFDASTKLVSRLFREMEKRTLSVHNVAKITVLADQGAQQTQKMAISDKVSLEVGIDEATATVKNSMEYLRGLHALCVGMARAGVAPVEGCPGEEKRGSDSTDFVIVPLDLMLRYHQRAYERSSKVSTHRLEWLVRKDTDERKIWCELFHNSDKPLGKVVLEVMKEREVMWQPPSEHEAPSVKTSTHESGSSGGSKRKAEPPGKFPAQQQQEQPVKYLKTLKNGQPICSYYQTGRCRNSDKCQYLHVCARSIGRTGDRACGLRHAGKDCLVK